MTTLTCAAGTITATYRPGPCPACGRSMGWDGHPYGPCAAMHPMSCGRTEPADDETAILRHAETCDDCYFEDNRRCLEDATGEAWDDDAVSHFLSCC